MPDDYGYQGIGDYSDGGAEFNSQIFLVQRLLALIPGSALVQVIAVTNTPGQLAPIGTVDVRPLVNQMDGKRKPTPHGPVYGLPYFRYQGGKNAILIDPQVNDIGLAVICSRDNSSVKANSKAGNTGNAQANPGSSRQNSWSDGCYLGSFLAPIPDQYVSFTATGLEIHDKNGNAVIFGPTGVLINGARITLGGDVITKLGHDLDTHLHTGVTTGSGNTGPPA